MCVCVCVPSRARVCALAAPKLGGAGPSCTEGRNAALMMRHSALQLDISTPPLPWPCLVPILQWHHHLSAPPAPPAVCWHERASREGHFIRRGQGRPPSPPRLSFFRGCGAVPCTTRTATFDEAALGAQRTPPPATSESPCPLFAPQLPARHPTLAQRTCPPCTNYSLSPFPHLLRISSLLSALCCCLL